ncbi:hypothetical protein FB451DRAFT_1464352 [Mycena latifolia]|nr:hypothetical protein FB451DRAFT_1464352 [Mycena latifolia]
MPVYYTLCPDNNLRTINFSDATTLNWAHFHQTSYVAAVWCISSIFRCSFDPVSVTIDSIMEDTRTSDSRKKGAGPLTHAAARALAPPESSCASLRLRSARSSSARSSPPPPIRQLVTRVAARTSTLHALVHAHSHSSSSPSSQHAAAAAEVEALRSRLSRLEARVAAQDGALAAYVDDALAPVEKGIGASSAVWINYVRSRPYLTSRCPWRRRGRRARHGGQGNEHEHGVRPGAAEPPGVFAGWFESLSLPLSAPPPVSTPAPASVYTSAPGGIPSLTRRRAGGLEPILEEGEGEHTAYASSSSSRPAASSFSAHPSASAYTYAHAPPALVHAPTTAAPGAPPPVRRAHGLAPLPWPRAHFLAPPRARGAGSRRIVLILRGCRLVCLVFVSLVGLCTSLRPVLPSPS